MEQLLKDWSDYIVEIPIFIVTISLSIYFYLRQREYKKLGYETIVNYSLFDVKKDIKEKVKITYNDNEVKNMRLISLKILNNGKLPILTSDFDKNIDIVFNKEAEIIEIEVNEKFPINLDVVIESSRNIISILPCLLNPKDFIIIKVILDSPDNNFDILSRIVGIDQIVKITGKEVKTQRTISLIMFLFSLYLLIDIIRTQLNYGRDQVMGYFLITLFIIASIFFYFNYLASKRES